MLFSSRLKNDCKGNVELYKVEKAKLTDIPQMHHLINFFADRDEMLARPLSELYEDIRDFYVVRDETTGEVIGCASLHISWSDLAEVKALAVDISRQKQGIGRLLVDACINEAIEYDIPKLFCLTYKPGFFKKMGFGEVDKMTMPRKIWTECFRCPKFPDCDEIAMTRTLKEDSNE